MSAIEPKATIIVVPRERFSYTQQSLESIYQNTNIPFKLIYVDGNSPRKIKQYLEAQAKEKGFQLIRTDHFLSPNEARNIGLAQVNTKYIIFVDNDILVKPDWLQNLVQCADETDAAVVQPLCYEGENFERIHMVGGKSEFRQVKGKQWLVEKRPFMHLPIQKLNTTLKREPTEIIEFHCVLARKDLFTEIGSLDQNLLSMTEESDFSLEVSRAGKTIYFEPSSVMTYVAPPPLAWSDLPFFYVRWSNIWRQKSIMHFKDKWNLDESAPILKHASDFVINHRRLAYLDSNTFQKDFPQKLKYTFKKLVFKGIGITINLILFLKRNSTFSQKFQTETQGD